MTWPNQFSDPTGRWTIGPDYDPDCSAPYARDRGRIVGVYIDDTTPNIRQWIAKAVAKYPHGTVFVGIPDGEPRLRHHPQPPIVNLQEWYPYGGPWTWRQWGPLPRCVGYILQWNLPGLDGAGNVVHGPPPTRRQRNRLVRWAKLRRAKYIFQY